MALPGVQVLFNSCWPCRSRKAGSRSQTFSAMSSSSPSLRPPLVALLIAPTSYHRLRWRDEDKDESCRLEPAHDRRARRAAVAIAAVVLLVIDYIFETSTESRLRPPSSRSSSRCGTACRSTAGCVAVDHVDALDHDVRRSAGRARRSRAPRSRRRRPCLGDAAEDRVLAVEPRRASAVTMKNWLPFVFGPAFAIASAPRTTLSSLNSSSNW